MSEAINNGGPAFPGVRIESGDNYNPPKKIYRGGMTLRDYFAAKAMPLAIRQWHEEAQAEFHRRHSEQSGFVWLDEDSEEGSDCHIVATYAYAMADAMLKARKTT